MVRTLGDRLLARPSISVTESNADLRRSKWGADERLRAPAAAARGSAELVGDRSSGTSSTSTCPRVSDRFGSHDSQELFLPSLGAVQRNKKHHPVPAKVGSHQKVKEGEHSNTNSNGAPSGVQGRLGSKPSFALADRNRSPATPQAQPTRPGQDKT